MSISALLRLARQSADLRCRGLAKMCGLAPATISLAELGDLEYSDRTRRLVLGVLLREVARAQGIQQPRCISELEVRRELSRLIAAAEVMRAERALLSADAVLATWA